MLYTDERITELLDANTLYTTGAIHYIAAAQLLSGMRDEYEAALVAQATEIAALQAQVATLVAALTDAGDKDRDQAAEIERLKRDNEELLHLRDMEYGRHQLAQQEIERLRAVPVPATQDDLARALARFDAYALRTLFEQTITLFLEYRDQHGFADEEQAAQMAVSDSVAGVYAIRETDAFEAEMRQAHP